jgi:hypothetical protein
LILTASSAALLKASVSENIDREKTKMTRRFHVGDHVTWNSEAGQVSGKIIKVQTRNIAYKWYPHHASKKAPQ